MRTITVDKRNGTTKSVETEMTDDEALETLITLTRPGDKLDQNGFACSLADQSLKHDLSAKQIAWAIVLIEEAREKPQETAGEDPGVDLADLFPLFDMAAEAQKRLPQLTLSTRDGEPIRIQVCGDRSRYPGDLRVTDGGPYGESQYFGRIARDGALRRGKDCTDEVVETLVWAQGHLELAAKQHGLATGSCSFCGRPLSTRESRSVGYGPICAEKWGLPWGAIDPELEAEGKAPLGPKKGCVICGGVPPLCAKCGRPTADRWSPPVATGKRAKQIDALEEASDYEGEFHDDMGGPTI